MIYEISIRGAFGGGNRFWLEQKSRSTFRRVCVSSLYLFLYTRSHLRFKLLSKKESLCTTQSKESPSKEAYGMQCMFAFEPNIHSDHRSCLSWKLEQPFFHDSSQHGTNPRLK